MLVLPAAHSSRIKVPAADVFDLNFYNGGADAAALSAAGFTTTRSSSGYDENGTAYSSNVPVILAGRGLWCEDAATNLILQSDDINNAAWTKTNSSVTTGQADSTGGTGACRLNDNGSNGNHEATQQVTLTSGTVYAWSRVVKAGTLSQVSLAVPEESVSAIFGLSGSGSVVSSSMGTAGTGAFIYPLQASGWYRVAITFTASASAARTFSTRTATGGSDSYAGTGTDYVVVFRAQLESGFQGKCSTPIPTTSASVTRATNTHRVTRGSAVAVGTVLVSYRSSIQGSSAIQMNWGIDSGSSTNFLRFGRSTSKGTNCSLTSAGSSLFSAGSLNNQMTDNADWKMCLAFQTGDFEWWFSGNLTSRQTQTSALPGTLVREEIGTASGTSWLNSYVRRVARWSTRLTGAQMFAAMAASV